MGQMIATNLFRKGGFERLVNLVSKLEEGVASAAPTSRNPILEQFISEVLPSEFQ